MFLKYFLSFFFTLFLGPGIGHLFLGKYKKALILVGLVVFFMFLTGFALLQSINVNDLPTESEALMQFLKTLIAENSNKMLIMDIPLAFIWSYAFVDIVKYAVSDYKEFKRNAK